MCQPTFSASLIGYAEATIDDEDTKNYLCQPIIVPDVPLDWLRMMRTNLQNHLRWDEYPDVRRWLSTVRTRSFISDPAFYGDTRPDVTAQLARFHELLPQATAAIDRLLEDQVEPVAQG